VRIRVRARDVMLATAAPDNISALNIFSGIVAEVGRATGPVVDIQVDCGGDILLARITRFSVERLGLEPGTPVFAIVKSIALERRTISAALPASMV
jgi:molybdate transport system ATP-binding protein